MAYNEADELVQAIAPDGTVTTTAYDANGNTEVVNANGQVTTNTWDGENRLVGVVNPDASVETHAYAASGLRQSTQTTLGTTNFLWDQQNILQERDGALALLAAYTLFPGTWGGLASMRRGGASSFYGFDLQGTTRSLLDALAGVTDRYWMTAFGEEMASSGVTANPFRYGGRYQYHGDRPRRLQVRMREVDPVWGRWLSRDPLPYGASDLYVYVANRPYLVDPSGLSFWCPCWLFKSCCVPPPPPPPPPPPQKRCCPTLGEILEAIETGAGYAAPAVGGELASGCSPTVFCSIILTKCEAWELESFEKGLENTQSSKDLAQRCKQWGDYCSSQQNKK